MSTLLIVSTIFLAALLQSLSGFGFAVIVMPVVTLIGRPVMIHACPRLEMAVRTGRGCDPTVITRLSVTLSKATSLIGITDRPATG